MALSDVSVTVNITGAQGQDSDWFPLFVDYDSGFSGAQNLEYTEFTSLSALMDALLPESALEDKTRKEKNELKTNVKENMLLYRMVAQMWAQNNHPNKFAVVYDHGSGAAGQYASQYHAKVLPYIDKGWRQLVLCTSNSEKYHMYLPTTAVAYYADIIENLVDESGQRKMLYVCCDDPSAYQEWDNDDKNIQYYDRVVCVYHPDEPEMALAAVVGATAGKTPGSLNYRNVVLNNISAVALAQDELDEIHNYGCIVPVERAGDVVTSYGKDTSGNYYIDVIDIEDYVVEQLVYQSQKALNANDIVPYNNDGIAILENAATNVMAQCAAMGMIARSGTETYQYSINFPEFSNVPSDDINNRTYTLGEVWFIVQGAIDTEEITVDMQTEY